MMDRKFEKYRGGPTVAASERLHVTLARYGRLFFNRTVYERLGKPAAIYIYFSRTDDQIAIEPSSPNLPESMPVLAARNGWRVNAAPFCRHFGIKLDTTEKFIRPEINEGHLILKLAETSSVSKRPRRKG